MMILIQSNQKETKNLQILKGENQDLIWLAVFHMEFIIILTERCHFSLLKEDNMK